MELIELNDKEKLAREKLCFAMDNIKELDKVEEIVKELSPYVGLFKVGMESYTRFGPRVVELIKGYGSEMFLDLKYHDIPNTVVGAGSAVSDLKGIRFFNIHASNGYETCKKTKEKLVEVKADAKVIGVTVLTSMDLVRYFHTHALPVIETWPENFKGADDLLKFPYTTLINYDSEFRKDPNFKDKFEYECMLENFKGLLGENGDRYVSNAVKHMASIAVNAGLDGIVCSAADLENLKLPKDFMTVTPGIKGRKKGAGSDQSRVFTAGKAVQAGSDVLVVGRAIGNAEDRAEAAYDMLNEMAEYL
ncbi:orotidine 5'-phosphate decarboxylase [Candidatus Woesearchaeota archaeon]|nr:orotidine 5'-phosphate decarboxylase [Candidatus Woesearchaeota archaeon]